MSEPIFDVVIVGGGPAGLSAAVNVIARGGTAAVLSNPTEQNPLWKTARIDNCPGMAGVSGADLLTAMRRDAEAAGTVFFPGHVSAILPFGGKFAVTVGSDIVTGRRLILAVGASSAPTIPGEDRFVGQGISYCATCDGRLYKGRRVLVTGNAADLPEEAQFLASVGAEVTVVTKQPVSLPENIPHRVAKSIALWETDGKLQGLTADGDHLLADGVFILRQVTAPTLLLPRLKTEEKHIAVDRQMRTGIPGCYAAGDAVGAPYQIAKAVGEGLIAGQDAMRSLKEEKAQ